MSLLMSDASVDLFVLYFVTPQAFPSFTSVDQALISKGLFLSTSYTMYICRYAWYLKFFVEKN